MTCDHDRIGCVTPDRDPPPIVRNLRDFLADAPEPEPLPDTFDGIALDYPGEGPPGAPFIGEERQEFIRRTAALARHVRLSEYETRSRLLSFSDEFCTPPLPDREVLALMAEEWEK